MPYFRFYRDGVQISGDYETGTSYTLAAQDAGVYECAVAAVDVAGNVSPVSAILKVTIDPTITETPDLVSAADSGVSDSDNITRLNNATAQTTLQFLVANTAVGAKVTLYADGTAIGSAVASGTSTVVTTNGSALLADGAHVFQARQVLDETESPASGMLQITIDTVAPMRIDAPDLDAGSDSGSLNNDNLTNIKTPKLLVPVAEYFRVFCDGVQFSGDYQTGTSFNSPTRADGTYAFTVAAVDPAGNVSTFSEALQVTIDTKAPLAPAAPDLQTASDGGFSNTDNITADNTPTFDIAGAPYYCFYRGGTLVSGNYEAGSSYTLRATSDGAYPFTVAAVDLAGNVSPQSPALTVTIDTNAPTTPPAPDLDAASDSGKLNSDNITNVATLTLSVPGAAYYRLYRDGLPISPDYQSGTLTTAALPDGIYSFIAVSIDAAGNISSASPALGVTIDTTAPAAPSAPDLQAASDTGLSNTDNLTNDTTPTFSVLATPYFRVYRGNTLISGAFESGTAYTAPVQDTGTGAYSLAAVDIAGNESAKSPALSVTIDTAAPTVQFSAVDPNPRKQPVSELVFQFSEAVAGVDVPDLRLNRDGGANLLTGSEPLSGTDQKKWTLGGLSALTAAPGAYRLALIAAGSGIADIAGNALAADASVTWTVNTPPAVDAGADRTIGMGQVLSISGSFADPNTDTWTATVDYGEGADPISLTLKADKTFALDHTYSKEGLYTITVRVTDSLGENGTDAVQVDVRGASFRGSAADDSFYLKTEGELVKFYENADPAGPPTFVIARNLVSTVAVDGGGGKDTLTIKDGQLSFAVDLHEKNANLSLTLTGDAHVSFSAAQQLAGLSLSDTALVKLDVPDGGLLRTRNLQIGPEATLDVTDDGLIVQADQDTRRQLLESISKAIQSARNADPLWSGKGITTTAADPQKLHGLGVLLNEANGQPICPDYDTSTIIVKYTLNGDMDLNGTVNTLDYARIDQGFLSQGSAEPLKGYQNGDIDYNGQINTLDYALVDSAFLGQHTKQGAPARPAPAAKVVAPAQKRITRKNTKRVLKAKRWRFAV